MINTYMNSNKELVQQLRNALNKAAEDYYEDVVVPLRKQISVIKMEKLVLQDENRKLKQILEDSTKKPAEAYLTHHDAERYRSIIQKKELEIMALKKEISKLKNPEISRYSISIKNKKGR